VQLWSRLGRLKRSSFPKLTGGGHTFGGGAAPGLLSVLAGRLLCDTYLSGGQQHGWLGAGWACSSVTSWQTFLMQQLRCWQLHVCPAHYN
jgi:hypothetical protein